MKTSKYLIQNILKEAHRLQYDHFDKVGMDIMSWAYTRPDTGERVNDVRVDVMGGERIMRFQFSVRKSHEENNAELLRMKRYIADLAYKAEQEAV